MGALTLGVIIEFIVWIVSILLLIIDGKIPFSRMKDAYINTPHFFVAGLLLMGGSLFVNIALTKVTIAELNIMGMFGFPVTIIAAYIFYKERPSIKEWIGILLIICSLFYMIIV